jgi:hypothetical protein
LSLPKPSLHRNTCFWHAAVKKPSVNKESLQEVDENRKLKNGGILGNKEITSSSTVLDSMLNDVASDAPLCEKLKD